MRLLPVAVKKQRWDLAAHTIILATARVLKNGDKPDDAKRFSGNSSIRITGGSAVSRVTKTGRKKFGRKKRGSKRQSER